MNLQKLYAWGANSHGQLGLGYESEMATTPQQISQFPAGFLLSDIKQIKGGGGHCLFLDALGHVYASGWNNKGQLGIGTITNETAITAVSADPFNGLNIVQIECGWDSSAAVAADGSIFIWGSNAYQQLGIAKTQLPMSSRPIELKLPGMEKCAQVRFGLRNACFLTTEGFVYFVGAPKAMLEQLLADEQCELIKHNDIDFWKMNVRVDLIVCGQNNVLYRRTDAINVLLGLGGNKYGQSTSVNIVGDIKSLKSGWTHNGYLNDAGEVWLWGRNSYGQTATDPLVTGVSVRYPAKLNWHEAIGELHLGAEHGMAITKSKNVLTWGWNEHGNCGNESVENVYSPMTVSIAGECVLAATGAGFCYALMHEKPQTKSIKASER